MTRSPRPAAEPSLRQLRAFEAVAALGSFSRAAESLALTQPALSATIRELELRLGTRLLTRSTHHVALTEAGAALRPQVQWLINSMAHGLDGLQRTLQGQARRLRIAVLPSAMHLLAPPLADWQAHHRGVEVQLQDLLNDQLVAALLAGEVDIALGVALDLPPQITTAPVTDDALVAVLPQAHALARRRQLRWRDLAGQPLALFAGGSSHDLALATLRQQGVDLQSAQRLQYSESLYGLVESGLAIGLIPHLYTHGLHARQVLVRRLQAPEIARRVVLMRLHTTAGTHPLVDDVFAHLARALAPATPPHLPPAAV